ncbi:MAG: LptF/LptG family permease [Dysgonamonadaceae bacterium]|nr:LptF/LptG family permease [Dysgonamonadaceae bacterium]MDD3308605.1 LptF/LptG family permease [Dysgonamonadaceae bacterium]MDD3900724.1 LptF/LptG family permease [Dysgonamonadaceae bacterium]MDD4398288.1 LptF/LptG family permease [Dysgonamonadaceae bacterium]MEA5080660.1 LptF/LptG family permease [Dysgonamonadaceae bacterium]
MRVNFSIKSLYNYLLKNFIPVFIMTFVICLFLVMMQFVWKYIADMVGKGLDIDVLGELFFYAALNFIPLALPLSILLASLMTFGNMGENLELLSIKAAGISLIKLMKPLIVLIGLISVGAFFFQNNAMPTIQTKFYTLLYSVRTASPELEIPEGTFYKELNGYNLYVDKKNRETGMMYDVFIYDVTKGNINDMGVIVCDSAEMMSSADKMSIIFNVYSGQQFQNFQQGGGINQNKGKFMPYAREMFKQKQLVIPFNANFNKWDESVIQENTSSGYVSKNVNELSFSIDSMKRVVDSVNLIDRKNMLDYSYLSFRNNYPEKGYDSIIVEAQTVEVPSSDTIFDSQELNVKLTILQNAIVKAENNSNDYLFRSLSKVSTQKAINRYWIELHRKFTLSFACVIFFFIGAPLGSIVRKGGLGLPIVISVILFIIYYILDNVGYKMARDGVWIHWFGSWFSSMILLPLGIFLTYKAMNDAPIMNGDTYIAFFKKLFLVRDKRNYPQKEVVIEEPNAEAIIKNIDKLSDQVDEHLQIYSKLGYRAYWMDNVYDTKLFAIKNSLENMLNELSNSRKRYILEKAEEYPILISHMRIFKTGSIGSTICMYVFPIGIIIKLFSRIYENRIRKDIIDIRRLNAEMKELIQNIDTKAN